MSGLTQFQLNHPDSPTSIRSLDLSLYLVTDSSLVPPGSTLAGHVENAIKGGVTVVQLREKKASTKEFIELGKKIHTITQKYGVPLLINDRVDVALAVGCEGVHVGWDDMDYSSARELVGPYAFVGISISNYTQLAHAFQKIHGDSTDLAQLSIVNGHTYFGVGPVYATATKPDHDTPLGIDGMVRILDGARKLQQNNIRQPEGGLNNPNNWLRCVAIGGINRDNIQVVRRPPGRKFVSGPDGVAVVSAIMASLDSEQASRELVQLIRQVDVQFKGPHSLTGSNSFKDYILKIAPIIISSIPMSSPLIHHITNNVVKNISANITLAIGASPIMSDAIEEVGDLALVNGSLVVNMGTATPDFYMLAKRAMEANILLGKPVVFDPVGAGATTFRRNLAKSFIQDGLYTVIKGNKGEILTVAGEEVNMKGVDSGNCGETQLEGLVDIVRTMAHNKSTIVVMTGKTDIISDGIYTALLQNGHEILSTVTGTGCSLASIIAACLATDVLKFCPNVRDPAEFDRVVTAVLAYTIASEYAWELKETSGPGSFQQSFLDVLYHMTRLEERTGQGRKSFHSKESYDFKAWTLRAKIAMIDHMEETWRDQLNDF